MADDVYKRQGPVRQCHNCIENFVKRKRETILWLTRKTTPTISHKLLIDENTAPVVKQIFEWAHEHVALNRIVRNLNEMGIPLFGGRLGGTIEYYDKRTSDLIYTYEVSTNSYPFGTMPANVGDISNKGIEFTINATPIQTNNFSWQTSLNLSHNKNNVESISTVSYTHLQRS